jgi:hypothetical protein
MSYITLRGRWCHIIVLNVHAPTEDKTDDVKNSFYEELEFSKYHTKILLDFNAKVCRENILKQTIGNESLYEISNNNGVRVVNFAISKNQTVKSTMLSHHNIVCEGIQVYMIKAFRAASCDTGQYLMVAKVWERLAVNRKRSHRYLMERFNLKKLNDVEGKEQFYV